MKTYLFTLFLLCGCFFSINTQAQRKQINLRQVDPRFTVRAERYWSSLGGSEDYFYYVQNNTNQEYKIVVEITLDLACVGTRTYRLGFNKVVYLPPNGRFTPDDDYFHIITSGADNNKNCRLKDGDSYTLFKSIKYQISDVINMTQEKADAAKKKADEAAKKAEAEAVAKKAKEDAAAKKAQDDALAKKAKDDAAAQKAKEDAASKTKLAESKLAESKPGTDIGGGSASSSSSGVRTAAKTSASDTEAEKRESEAEKRQRDAEAKAEAARLEAEKQKKEAEAKVERQQEYDEWKAERKDEQAKMDAAATTASFSMLYLMGGMIYEGMGKINPDYVFKPGNKVRFHIGFDLGFSGVMYPSLFASDRSTMIGGEYYDTQELIARDLYHVNLNVKTKIGVEHPLFGLHGYIAPNVGISPTFDGYNFAPLNFGGQAFAGLKFMKGFADYSIGQRFFSTISTDPEELGAGTTDIAYEKLTYGIKFSTKANGDFTRSHISLGMIEEKINVDFAQAYVDPIDGNLVKKAKSQIIKGYTFQWKKDHNFNLFVNAYPNYHYAGDTETISAGLSSEFSTKKSSPFVEIGFLRSIDLW